MAPWMPNTMPMDKSGRPEVNTLPDGHDKSDRPNPDEDRHQIEPNRACAVKTGIGVMVEEVHEESPESDHTPSETDKDQDQSQHLVKVGPARHVVRVVPKWWAD